MNETKYPPGLLPGSLLMTNEEYHGDTTRISKSGITKMGETPAHYYAAYLDPLRKKPAPTPAMVTGTIVHSAILERDDFENQYIVMPKFDMRTNAGKAGAIEFMNNLGSKMECSQDNYDLARWIRDSVLEHPAASELLEGVVTEQTFHFEDPDTGALCKVRPDAANEEMKLIIDIKTADDASQFGFARSAAKYEYDIQDPFYLDGILFASGVHYRGFVFIAVEKEPPYAVGCYALPIRARNSGREKYQDRLKTYVSCKKTQLLMPPEKARQAWPAYSSIVEPLPLPEYAYTTKYKKQTEPDTY